jgi:diguanylate cyclase (GGDEF)-like protein
MPQFGEDPQPQPSVEDSFLDLLVETLGGLEESARGQFLRQFLRTFVQIDLTEAQSSDYWKRILQRREELGAGAGKKVSLKTAIVDVLSSANLLRVPILVEYDEFKKLQINAATDALTGLYNRRVFDETCEKELNRAKRYGQPLAIVILDLNKLKDVNDRHGHLVGDQVLQLAATTLGKTLRASDFASRIGGDEFALLLPQADPEQAITLCRRIRTQYENEVRALQLNIPVTLDFGVAVHPQDGDQKSELLRLADERLYGLKRSSRASQRVTPLEVPPPQEAVAAAPPPPPPPRAAAAAATGPTVVPSPARQDDQRKWERVSLGGTKAHAVLAELGQKTAKIVDLSYGGVALLFDQEEELPSQFNAVLHVPILPPVRVILRTTYTLRIEGGRTRVGCSFVS